MSSATPVVADKNQAAEDMDLAAEPSNPRGSKSRSRSPPRSRRGEAASEAESPPEEPTDPAEELTLYVACKDGDPFRVYEAHTRGAALRAFLWDERKRILDYSIVCTYDTCHHERCQILKQYSFLFRGGSYHRRELLQVTEEEIERLLMDYEFHSLTQLPRRVVSQIEFARKRVGKGR